MITGVLWNEGDPQPRYPDDHDNSIEPEWGAAAAGPNAALANPAAMAKPRMDVVSNNDVALLRAVVRPRAAPKSAENATIRAMTPKTAGYATPR
jgi:hypothetical protein